jgi:hypothetical protein
MLSKVDIAVIQFESAISAYKINAFIEAITLAGAAEELLGKLCKLKNKETAVTSFFNIAKLHEETIDEKKYTSYLNKHRNALKHFDEDKEFHIEVNLEDAKAMLVRATINFVRLGLTPTKLIDDFICELNNELKTLKVSSEFVADGNPVM